jgi:hypothetical protein
MHESSPDNEPPNRCWSDFVFGFSIQYKKLHSQIAFYGQVIAFFKDRIGPALQIVIGGTV